MTSLRIFSRKSTDSRVTQIPVSVVKKYETGWTPSGTAAYEKRGVATDVPVWDATKCIECNQCSYVCPHAAIRPVAMTEAEAAKLRKECR